MVTTRGLPYRVTLDAGYTVGFEALLQVHRSRVRRDDTLLAGSPQTDVGGYFAASVENPTFVGGRPSTTACDFTESNPYALWYAAACQLLNAGDLPEAFDRHGSWDIGAWLMADNLFIVTRLDGFDAEDAMDLVDRGVAADGTFPTAPLLCMHGADDARGARDPECELVTRRLAEAGLPADWLASFDPALSGQTVGGYLTGAAEMTGAIAGNHFVAGAITDNITSFGAVPDNFFCDESGTTCPASETQTSVARFIRAGATGAHGAVAEPLNNVFPSASLYLLYTFGYSLGESYLFSQRYLYWQNLVLGDPLTTPWATRPTVALVEDSIPADGVLTVQASHPDGVARVAAYVGDQLLAEASGPSLQVDAALLGSAGDTVEFYLLAEAESATVTRSGWETETWTPRADVRGWHWDSVLLTEPSGEEGSTDTASPDSGDPPVPSDDSGAPPSADAAANASGSDKSGGCSTSGTTSIGLLWLVGLAMARRRGSTI